MPQKQKLSPAEKAELVQRYLAGEIGVNEAGRLAGVDSEAVRGWVVRYETEGVEGFQCQERNRAYSPKEKKSAVIDYLSGTGSLLDVCKKYKIRSTRQLRNWIKVYNAHGDFNSSKFSGGGSYPLFLPWFPG